MRTRSGPVIFTTVYAISIIGTVAVLLLHDRWSEVSIRTWSPLIQAFLSALAIVAGFYVQSWKRQADRAEAVEDTITVVAFTSGTLEGRAWGLRTHCRGGTLDLERLRLEKPLFVSALARLEAINISHLHGADAIRPFLRYLADCQGFVTVLDQIENRLSGKAVAPKPRLDSMYERMFEKRTTLMEQIRRETSPLRKDLKP